jgi:CHASE2 domain-containing sensor protein
MKKRSRREKRKDRPKGPANGPQAHLPVRDHEAITYIIADVIKGLLLVGILLIVKWGVEHYPVSQRLEESVYDVLQLRLSSNLDAKALKVIVVDITDMKMNRHPYDRKYDFTDRDELQDLVQKIAAEQPSAIGIDTDFTPYSNQRAQDLRFLDFCLSLKKSEGSSERLPVHVGLNEAVALGPDLCLAEQRFGVLAAFVGFPNVGENEFRRRIVEYLEVPYENEAKQKRVWKCPSLAVAVAQKAVKPPWPVIAWATNAVTPKQSYDYKSTEFMIDYSPLEALENNTVPLPDLDSYLHKNYFRDKYVLIGRGKLSKDTGDKYPIPGRPGNSHAGVYVHACAAYTLLRGPLFELTSKGRVVFDIILALSVMLSVAAVRYKHRRETQLVAHQRVLTFFTLLAVLVTIGVGFFMVNMTRLMWDDFFVVAVSLLLHRSMESKTEGLTVWFVHSLRGAWRSLLFGPPAGSAKD